MIPVAGIDATLLNFCRLLRDHGLPVTPGRAIDSARSAALVDSHDEAAFRTALRANLTVSPEEHALFDDLFDAFWLRTPEQERLTTIADLTPTVEGSPRPPEAVYIPVEISIEGIDGSGESLLPGGDRSANAADLLTKKDFASLTGADVGRARRMVRRIAPRLATVASRRSESARSGRIDLRRTLRVAHRSHGEMLHISWRRPRRGKLQVVALLDVSGSMDRYAPYLLEFFYALQAEQSGVRTFAFSTRLRDISALLRRKRFDDARAALSAGVEAWSGGTTIGECLRQFNRRFARELVGSRTVVIIASDGWERAETSLLSHEMELLQRRARRIVWLNPLKGLEGYEPLAAGMAAALPSIDLFLPAHNLASLERLAEALAASH